jgi:hypothetical protein
VKKFQTFCETRPLTIFIRTRHWTVILRQMNPVNTTTLHVFRVQFIITPLPSQRLPSGIYPFGVLECLHVCKLSPLCYITRTSFVPWVNTLVTYSETQIMKLVITQFSPFSCHFLGQNILPRIPLSNILNL